jgi:hypothetical protein
MISIKHTFHRDNFAKLGETPLKDWRFALVCFVGGIVAVVAIDGLLFISLAKDKVLESSATSPVTLDKDELVETVKAVKKADADAAAIPESVQYDPGI